MPGTSELRQPYGLKSQTEISPPEDAQIQHMAVKPASSIKSVNTESGAAFDGASSPSGFNISA